MAWVGVASEVWAWTTSTSNLPETEAIAPQSSDALNSYPQQTVEDMISSNAASQHDETTLNSFDFEPVQERDEDVLLQVYITQIEVLGNTVLQAEIADLVAPFESRNVTFDELTALRSAITQLYIDSGYISSGAFIPNNQDLSSGIVKIQVLEGDLEAIEIAGLRRLHESYVRDRIAQNISIPLNQSDVEEALQLLQLNPLIRRINAELTVGSMPGRSILWVEIDEANPFQVGIGGDNYQSSSIGSEQFSISVSHGNLLGLGDRLSASYGITEGLNSWGVSYAIPLNALEGTLALSYSNDESEIVEAAFREFDIRSESETFSISFRQPLYRRPTNELALGLGFDVRRSQTYILDDEPFSFSEGPEDGESRVSVLRFFQDWVQQDAQTVLAARSQFSVGLDVFDATVNDSGTDARFVAWLGQFQWVEQVSPRFLLVTRMISQLTPDSLLPLERFGFGGVTTVRGYPQNQLVTDNGILASVEVRIPITDNPNRLQLTPFMESAYGWNNKTPNPSDNLLLSVGLGVRWLITPDLSLQLDYGIPLINRGDRGNSLSDSGFYFSIQYQPF
jgi:hemolysin activation/secretion protein